MSTTEAALKPGSALPRLPGRLREAADELLELGARSDVYVGCAPRLRLAGDRGALGPAWVLWVDCDGAASVARLAEFVPAPAVVVRSGSATNVHAYWPLVRPLAPASGTRATRTRWSSSTGSSGSSPSGHPRRRNRQHAVPRRAPRPPAAAVLAHLGHVGAQLVDDEANAVDGQVADALAGVRIRRVVVVRAQQGVDEEPRDVDVGRRGLTAMAELEAVVADYLAQAERSDASEPLARARVAALHLAMFAATTCVCSCGSSARLMRWR